MQAAVERDTAARSRSAYAGCELGPGCEFYTRHPYPPPVANLDRARDEWRDPNRQSRRASPVVARPAVSARIWTFSSPGCGTWQAAKYALCRPEARVVGIDVSATSIDHTEQLKRQYGLTNLELRQLPIERVGSWSASSI